MKIGRNDKCDCGSGLKFKKCCLNKEQSKNEKQETEPLQNIFQLHQFIVKKYFEENHLDIDYEKRIFEEIIFSSISDYSISSIEILKAKIDLCEKLIKEVATKHNTYDMLFWSRRLAPYNIFNVSEMSVMLYKEIQALSIYKYGISVEDIYNDENLGTFPINLKDFFTIDSKLALEKIKKNKLPVSISNLISDVIRIEILSYIFLNYTQFYRIANKNGILKFERKHSKILHSLTYEQQYLIDLYDERLVHANILSNTGAYINDSIKNQEDQNTFCPLFQLNVDLKTKLPVYNPKNEHYRKTFKNDNDKIEFAPNYLLAGINLKNVYSFLCLFDEEFKLKYNFTVEDFVVFLAFLGRKVVSNIIESLNFQIHIFNRAYTTMDYNLDTLGKDYIDNYKNIYENITGVKFDNRDLVKVNQNEIIKKFLLESSDKNEIDLWTRGPKKILYQLSENLMVFDYTGLTDIISYTCKELTMVDGETGNKRAISFEDELVSKVLSVYGHKKTWINRKVIYSKNGQKEIDASFIIDDVLFLLEAKAINVSFGYDKGDQKALKYRIDKMKSAIKELISKTDFIKKNRKELNPTLPNDINYICPIVISSYPEYIWEKTEDLFLSEEKKIPRILTLNEIELIKQIDLKEIKKLKWIVEI